MEEDYDVSKMADIMCGCVSCKERHKDATSCKDCKAYNLAMKLSAVLFLKGYGNVKKGIRGFSKKLKSVAYIPGDYCEPVVKVSQIDSLLEDLKI